MVYVDILRSCLPNPSWKYTKSCHLFADSEEELHAFAKRLNLKRGWYQRVSRLKHYDLTESKRKRAIKLGAVEADREIVVAHMAPRLILDFIP